MKFVHWFTHVNQMKALFLFLVTISILSCNSSNQKTAAAKTNNKDTVTGSETAYFGQQRDWQSAFGLTHNPDADSVWYKPVLFYLDDPMCSALALNFYYGLLRPSDNSITDELLELAATDNSKLRPFYRWCLDKTIQISDGALAEHIGVPARRYAEKFPEEFFEYMMKDSSGVRYAQWSAAINYSGFYEHEDWRKNDKLVNNVVRAMRKNCNNCDQGLQGKIEKFAKDCFSGSPG